VGSSGQNKKYSLVTFGKWISVHTNVLTAFSCGLEGDNLSEPVAFLLLWLHFRDLLKYPFSGGLTIIKFAISV
jgi:hypothetical protein